MYAVYFDVFMLQSPRVATDASQRRVPVQVNKLRDEVYALLIGY